MQCSNLIIIISITISECKQKDTSGQSRAVDKVPLNRRKPVLWQSYVQILIFHHITKSMDLICHPFKFIAMADRRHRPSATSTPPEFGVVGKVWFFPKVVEIPDIFIVIVVTISMYSRRAQHHFQPRAERASIPLKTGNSTLQHTG